MAILVVLNKAVGPVAEFVFKEHVRLILFFLFRAPIGELSLDLNADLDGVHRRIFVGGNAIREVIPLATRSDFERFVLVGVNRSTLLRWSPHVLF